MTLTVYTSRTWRRHHGCVNVVLVVLTICLIFLIIWLWPGRLEQNSSQHTQTKMKTNRRNKITHSPTIQDQSSLKTAPPRPGPATQPGAAPKESHLQVDEVRVIPQIETTDEDEVTCQVPWLDLENDEIKEYFYKLRPLVCNGSQLFYLVDSVLRLNKTIADTLKIAYCDYRAIDRISDRVFTYSSSVTRTTDFELVVNHDFFTVDCYLLKENALNIAQNQTNPDIVGSKDALNIKPSLKYDNISFDTHGDYKSRSWGKRLRDWINFSPKKPDFRQIFSQIYPRNDVLERLAASKPSLGSTQLNVLILGIESMSHLSYQRTLPLTYEYLLNIGAVVLDSYNVVGDGTTGTYIPLLTGKTEAELPKIGWGPFTKYADVYPLIWKEFKESGYVTLYGEDYPLIETFQMRMNGFDRAPVDHYMRAFWQAAYDLDPNLKKRGTYPCLSGRPRHRYMLEYLQDFFVKYPDTPKFAFEHLTGMSSDDPNMVQHADSDIRDFLAWMKENGHLDNTLLIVMSDHGSRFSSIQQTAQGKLEERLPMMSLTFPGHFQEKYPHLMSCLGTNTDRLTTPFDVHETLKTILNIHTLDTAVMPDDRGISLLAEIPPTRRCSDAGIGVHWCTCLDYESLSPEDPNVRDLGYYLVHMINNKTEEVRSQCIELHLQRVVEARLLYPSNQIVDTDEPAGFEMNVAHYELTVQTTPNDGVYEATLRGYVNDKTIKILGGISRINKYGDQSKCIVDKYPGLRKYCFCRP